MITPQNIKRGPLILITILPAIAGSIRGRNRIGCKNLIFIFNHLAIVDKVVIVRKVWGGIRLGFLSLLLILILCP